MGKRRIHLYKNPEMSGDHLKDPLEPLAASLLQISSSSKDLGVGGWGFGIGGCGLGVCALGLGIGGWVLGSGVLASVLSMKRSHTP